MVSRKMERQQILVNTQLRSWVGDMLAQKIPFSVCLTSVNQE